MVERMNESEMMEHIIKIDEYLEVKMQIPKVLDAMTFKAITMKASKMFNISDMDVGFGIGRPRGTYNKVNNKVNKIEQEIRDNSVNPTRISVFSDDETRFIITERQRGRAFRDITNELNKKFNKSFTIKKVMDKNKNTKRNTPEKFKEFGGKL